MTVAGMIGPRGLLAVFPSTLSFYERIGMDDEHQQRRTYCTYKHVLMEKHLAWRAYVIMAHGHTVMNNHERLGREKWTMLWLK